MTSPVRRRAMAWSVRALPLVAIAACSSPTSLLEPQAAAARRITGLWWLLFWISAAVVVLIIALLGYSVVRRRPPGDDADPPTPPSWGAPFVILTGFVGTTAILVIVFVISVGDLAALSRADGSGGLRIDVIGNMWWWEAKYPGGAVTANEIHIPVGEPVEVVLTTDDVIHSFWVPKLHPKLDMIPGTENRLTLEAEEPGRYRGVCAEFCGLQHAHMQFFVVADPDFDQWLAAEQGPAAEPSATAATGRDVFLSSTCVGCHTIRGTDADAQLGPDLTHLASRETLFAGMLDNTRENLAQIISDPQEVKPGVVMPPTSLSEDEMDALLDYLESLK